MAHQVAADDGALAAVRRCGELVAEPGELRVAGAAAELDKAPRHAHQPLWAVLLLRATVPGGLGMLITTGPHRARRLSGICEAHSINALQNRLPGMSLYATRTDTHVRSPRSCTM